MLTTTPRLRLLYILLQVFKNGMILFWTYNADHVWKQQTTHRLCHGHMTSLVDVCYNITQNALYWCEQTTGDDGKISYSICKRQIIEDEEPKDIIKLGVKTTIVTDIPKSMLYPISHGVVLVTQEEKDKAQFIIRLCTSKGSVEIFVNNRWCSVRDVNIHSPLKFGQVAMKCLQHMSQLKEMSVQHITYNDQSQTLYLLTSTGTLYVLSQDKDTEYQVVTLSGFCVEDLIDMFPQNDCIGCAYPSNIKFYSLQTGDIVYTVDVQDGSKIEQLSDTLVGSLQHPILTSDGLYVVQKSSNMKESSEMSLLELYNFQSDAVRLSYIDQMQTYSTQPSSPISLDLLRQKWLSTIGTPPTSKLIEIVDPYLSQYWMLDNLRNEGFQDMNKISQLTPETVEKEVLHLLSTDSSLPFTTRQSQLVLLSKYFPRQVLTCLLSHLSFSDSEMSTSQYQRWQNALTQESPNMTGAMNAPLPIFELTCYLLYKYKPENLIQFVLHGQKMWDQKVGMSAFVRRRQTPMIYERALKCFPQPESSDDTDTAILAHVHILLISDISNGYTKAIHLLTKAKKWTECVELLTEYKDKCSEFGLLYQMTLAALTKNKVLDKYADRLFALMPNFDSTNDVIHEQTKDNQGYNIFCDDSEDDISVQSVRQHFLKSMKIL
ncbi:GTP-dependent protein binding [Mactra antiquata]